MDGVPCVRKHQDVSIGGGRGMRTMVAAWFEKGRDTRRGRVSVALVVSGLLLESGIVVVVLLPLVGAHAASTSTHGT